MQIQRAIFTAILFLGFIVLWYVKKREMLRHGIDPDMINRAERPIQRYFWAMEKLMTAALAVIMAVHAFFPGYVSLARPVVAGDGGTGAIAGFLTGILGLAVCRVAQSAMGRSWRVGIEYGAGPGLVTGGIFRFVRNPTYTGLFILCAGVWIINPTVLYSYWILAFFIVMEFQVRCEEEYLDAQYGDEYRAYRARTKRYLPFVY